MPNTYSQMYVQVVIVVKFRKSLIHKSWKDELYKYITGIVTNKGQKLLRINGVENHVHILLNIKPNLALSDLVKDIKVNSTNWINDRGFNDAKFQWQEGFGAFTYSISQLDNVIKYIENQEEHHKKQSFKEEYILFLKNFEIEYKDEYLFDFLE
ncbi:IS200/IS605 family transposase [Flavobacterium muglaense]|uniref:IS200/IS605 family transposase n=1 Tax=Flavobacterium muglaense TaxID=2764716 RepID=A0A923N4G2_9FLAO|nr:IS200/IS605 family transposase [Flavobacterium muglaense]MBC5838981.1 IS200/IS605 family transposase [Flavobacterium muglaense]MBC5845468.1 IS200/IS605 family transposase [Flavobacterium muglaense]